MEASESPPAAEPSPEGPGREECVEDASPSALPGCQHAPKNTTVTGSSALSQILDGAFQSENIDMLLTVLSQVTTWLRPPSGPSPLTLPPQVPAALNITWFHVHVPGRCCPPCLVTEPILPAGPLNTSYSLKHRFTLSGSLSSPRPSSQALLCLLNCLSYWTGASGETDHEARPCSSLHPWAPAQSQAHSGDSVTNAQRIKTITGKCMLLNRAVKETD